MLTIFVLTRILSENQPHPEPLFLSLSKDRRGHFSQSALTERQNARKNKRTDAGKDHRAAGQTALSREGPGNLLR